jgi:hypothetical protein
LSGNLRTVWLGIGRGEGGGGVGGKGGSGGRGEKWTKPCMHIWIIKEKGKNKQTKKLNRQCAKC